MSNIEDEKAPPLVKTIQFRVPEVLASAMQAGAARGICSISDVARQCVLRDMQRRGVIPEKK
jgi:hypothetical protein